MEIDTCPRVGWGYRENTSKSAENNQINATENSLFSFYLRTFFDPSSCSHLYSSNATGLEMCPELGAILTNPNGQEDDGSSSGAVLFISWPPTRSHTKFNI